MSQLDRIEANLRFIRSHLQHGGKHAPDCSWAILQLMIPRHPVLFFQHEPMPNSVPCRCRMGYDCGHAVQDEANMEFWRKENQRRRRAAEADQAEFDAKMEELKPLIRTTKCDCYLTEEAPTVTYDETPKMGMKGITAER